MDLEKDPHFAKFSTWS